MMTDDNILTPDEIKVLRDKGIEAAKGHEMSIPAYPKEKLQDFVRNYIAGRIYTDRDVPPNLVGMVFMPMMLGCIEPEGEAEAALIAVQVDIGEEPKIPEPPKGLGLPAKPQPLKTKKLLAPNPERIRQIRAEMGKGWPLGSPDGSEPEDTMVVYLARIDKLNAERKEKNKDSTLADRITRWETECAAIKAEHAVRLAEHAALVTSLDARRALRERQKAENAALRGGFMEQFASTLGCIWEDTGTGQTSPTAINGYPCFFSMRLMNRDDFKRVGLAIDREIARAKEMEV